MYSRCQQTPYSHTHVFVHVFFLWFRARTLAARPATASRPPAAAASDLEVLLIRLVRVGVRVPLLDLGLVASVLHLVLHVQRLVAVHAHVAPDSWPMREEEGGPVFMNTLYSYCIHV